ncbi:type VI secretion system ATPase TssH [Aliikangiella maris]|uniref:Type VI secretion system ATPase TssH n=2 Tax=Aliikangiella maris TaxID=3162458 RepID=A0ABV3MNA9_9GAMM
MSNNSLKMLVGKNNDFCKRKLEAAAGLCHSRTHHHVEVEHWLLKILEEPASDINVILGHFGIETQGVINDINRYCEKLRTGNIHPPSFSPYLVEALNKAWSVASLDFSEPEIRSGFILMAILVDDSFASMTRDFSPKFERINLAELKANFSSIVRGSCEQTNEQNEQDTQQKNQVKASSKTPALDQYTINLTAKAKEGKIDPVIGRDNEIRQIIDILTRRRQNNPILTGEAGVGKTAVVEGFALKLAEGQVPPSLQNITLRVLDLGLLQAGAGVKGEFENRLKDVIKEVQSSAQPIVLFIDEAHTMIGAGGQAGQGDAANLLKPALARGELRTIAATTWAEYKKYFEKDAALARRFQVVKIEEPSEEKAIQMLRGLAKTMAKHHQIDILNEAIEDAVRLSSRYISGRQLPDKAIGLLDTACARVQLSQSGVPGKIEDIKFQIFKNNTEKEILTRENAGNGKHNEALQRLEEELTQFNEKLNILEAHQKQELDLVNEIKQKKSQLDEVIAAKTDESAIDIIGQEIEKLQENLKILQANQPMVFECVDGQVIAEVVADWTGIPVGRMQSDEVKNILDLQQKMEERVVGQSHGLAAITKTVQTSRAKLTDPKRPIGVFMLAGPSGVGKTETALSLAEQVYGSEQNLTVINMSEFKEEHKVSLLMGSPPGYVGYGEGGVLTEAVRRKPYSVVLLDEMEKAHPGVQDIFYQVFDKGTIKDGEGRDIDFKNTTIIMTSNAGTDTIMKLADDPETMPDAEGMATAIRGDLLQIFKPAFLGRIQVIPYFPLGDEILKKITHIQLAKVAQRVTDNYAATIDFDNSVIDNIVMRCTEVDSGARNIHHIITNTILPELSLIFLNNMLDEKEMKNINVTVEYDQFKYEFV